MNDNHDAITTLADELERIGNMGANMFAFQDNKHLIPPVPAVEIANLRRSVSELSRAILLISQAVRSVR